jgi:quinoprotein glucose dehydrogenase
MSACGLLLVAILYSCGQQPGRKTSDSSQNETTNSGALKGRKGLEAIPLYDDGDLPRKLLGVGVDNQGKVYVTETERQGREEISLLQSSFLHEDDMALTTVKEKDAWIRKNFSARIAKSQGISDFNEDGVVDLKDLGINSERIFALEDTDNDGLFEEATLYSDGFNGITTGIAHSLLPIGNSVYATIIPDLWKLTDEDGDGHAEKRERLVHGFANHIGYGNHDLHSVVHAFDGKIYWSMGDRGLNVMSQEGKHWAYPNTGTIVRCNLDGSDFEVYASGLRNCQNFDFDDYGNLFAIDHDADFQGEQERLVFLPEGSDSGWRMYYQYRRINRVLKDKSKDYYSPWLSEQMWKPLHDGQPSHFLPPIENSWNAPASFSFQPGDALGGEYQRHFLLGGLGEIRAFKMVPNGSSFRREGEDVVVSGLGSQVLSSAFGPDGGLYFTLWSPPGGASPLWKLVKQVEQSKTNPSKVEILLSNGFEKSEVVDLIDLLGFNDRRVRQGVQFELVARNKLEELKKVILNKRAPELARIHGIWGLLQLKHWDDEVFEELWLEGNDELLRQEARWATEVGRQGKWNDQCKEALIRLLSYQSPKVKLLAAIGCGKLKVEKSLMYIENMIEKANNNVPVLREAGVIGLMGAASFEELEDYSGHGSESVRIAAVVALRRLGRTKELITFLEDSSPQVVSDAVLGIYDVADVKTFKDHPEALNAIAKMLNPSGQQEINIRALAANRRLGTRESLGRILTFLKSELDIQQLVRVMAMDMLASWTHSSTLDPVDGRHFPVRAGKVSDLETVFLPNAWELAHDGDVVVSLRAIDMFSKMNTKKISANYIDRVAGYILNEDMSSVLRLAWFSWLKDQRLEECDKVAQLALSTSAFEVRQQAANHLLKRNLRLDEVQEYLNRTLLGGESVETGELQGALKMLSQMPERIVILRNLVKGLTAGNVAPTIQLEVVEAATEAAKEDDQLLEILERYNDLTRTKKPFGEFEVALHGGNAQKGKSVFLGHLTAMCSKCHALKDDDKQVGPSLQSVGQRLTREELLESIIDPQAKIAPGYGIQTVVLLDGTVMTGTQLKEDAEQITLKLSDGMVKTIIKSEVKSMTTPIGAMPEVKALLSKRECRDLVAYLVTLNKK